MSLNTSLLFATLLVITNNIIFAGRSFKNQNHYLIKKNYNQKAVAAALKYYQKKQTKIKQDRTAKYDQDNTKPDFFISEIKNLQNRKDITF